MDNTFIFFRFLADKKTFFLELSNTNRDFLEEIPSASKTFKMDFVLGVSKSKSSTTVKFLDFTLILNADFLASFLAFLFTF